MKINWFACLLVVFFICCFSNSYTLIAYAGDSFDNPTRIFPDQDYSDNLLTETGYKTVFYMFELESNSNVIINLSHIDTNNGNVSEGWYLDLYMKNGNQYPKITKLELGNRKGAAYLNEGLTTGEYYLKIYCNNTPNDEPYFLRIEFDESEYYEKYPNHSFEDANEIISFNKDYIGNVGNEVSYSHTETKNNKYDYYFFRLTDDGNVTVRLSHNNTNEGVVSDGWYADLHMKDGKIY